jgi:hypothetical protein
MLRKMREDIEPTPLKVLATQMHEFYVTLRESGFTEEQALKLVALRLEQG